MKLNLSALLVGAFFSSTVLNASLTVLAPDVTVVKVPYISRQTTHVEYLHRLLALALENTKAEFGEYRIQYHDTEIQPERQLRELEKGELKSATFSHAKAKWDDASIRVPFPLAKGLGSYRFFFTLPKHLPVLEKVNSLQDFINSLSGKAEVGLRQPYLKNINSEGLQRPLCWAVHHVGVRAIDLSHARFF